MKDGLYRVTTKYLCAGFVIKDGKVNKCAPILRKNLSYWKTIATLIKTKKGI